MGRTVRYDRGGSYEAICDYVRRKLSCQPGALRPSYAQIHIYLGNPNEQGQRGPFGDVVGSQVYDPEGNQVGTLSRVVTDPRTGQPLFGVISSGGIFGLGAEDHPVPWQLFTPNPSGMTVNMTERRLRDSPSFSAGESPDLLSGHWQRRILEFYGPQPAPGGPAYHYGNRYGVREPFQRLFDRESMESVRGTITHVYHHTQGDLTQVALRTDAGQTILAILAPQQYLDNSGVRLRPGESLHVRGSHAVKDGRPFIIATSVRQGDNHVQIRDRDGVPQWHRQGYPEGGPGPIR